MMPHKTLPDGRRTWEPYAAVAAAMLGTLFLVCVCALLLLYGCTLQGSNGFWPY
jgi:hypothetical protein